MHLVILTGMSGAGKSTALKMLEDMGFFCVDNLPIPLFRKFHQLMADSDSEVEKAALGVDVRSGIAFEELESQLEQMEKEGISFDILFLDADDEILIKRYKETRRNHPLAIGERIDKGIAKEREMLAFLKKRADYIMDTTHLLTRELKGELERIFVDCADYKSIFVTILSFGFKYGIPSDSDLVFDVRFLPNPYYIEELREKSGNDKEIQDYVMSFDAAHEFIDQLEKMIKFLIPNYILEGKNQLVISIGCTGGKHRSVTLANELYHRLNKGERYGIKIEHRDIEKDAKRKRT